VLRAWVKSISWSKHLHWLLITRVGSARFNIQDRRSKVAALQSAQLKVEHTRVGALTTPQPSAAEFPVIRN